MAPGGQGYSGETAPQCAIHKRKDAKNLISIGVYLHANPLSTDKNTFFICFEP